MKENYNFLVVSGFILIFSVTRRSRSDFGYSLSYSHSISTDLTDVTPKASYIIYMYHEFAV